MKVFVSQLFHEASSFVPGMVNIEHFKSRHYLKGLDAVKSRFDKDKDWVAGALHQFLANGDDVHVGVCTACNPAGIIEEASFGKILQEMIDEYEGYLKVNGSPDVLFLLLHGANMVQNLADPDGFLVQKFMDAKGHEVKTVIGITFDFHANISDKLVSLADIVLVGIEYPHIDTYIRGSRAAELSRTKVLEGNDMKSFRFPIPILTSLPMQATVDDLPFARLIKYVEVIRSKYQLTDLVVAGGFAFGDSLDVGMCLVATNTTRDPCVNAYKEIADYVWRQKDELLGTVPNLDDVWSEIELRASRARIVVADVADSPGSGGTADETHLLRKLVGSHIKFVSAFHVDTEVVEQAFEVGVNGASIFRFGTALCHAKSKILEIEATVKTLKNYEYFNTGPMMNGARLNAGPTAVLDVGNGLVIVTTNRIQAYDINAFIGIGIDITIMQPLVIAVKSTAHFRASYTALADEGIQLVRCSGWSDIDFSLFDYEHRRIPLLPLETVTEDAWNTLISSQIE